MRIRRRIFAGAAVAAIATGAIVAVTETPALAAVHSCTYTTVTNLSNYTLASNWGFGEAQKCFRVQARASDDTGGPFLPVRYGPVSADQSRIDTIGYPLVYRQTHAAPIQGNWSLWTGQNFWAVATVTD